ncbi:MAG: hypothetical protein ACI9CU_001149 [Polaribacter sp.]|jgi:hypothetical protein
MVPKEKQRIQDEIRRKNELLRAATEDNPDVRRWKQEIDNLQSQLGL